MKNNLLELPQRAEKPRLKGITAVMDMGISYAEQKQILESYGDLLDLAKLGTGAPYINPILEKKISLYKDFDIPVWLGGTLFEKFVHQNKLQSYIDYLKSIDINWIEVSSGTIDIEKEELLAIINQLHNEFIVVAEVGNKFSYSSPDNWLKEIQLYLDAGVRYVILEGRGTADAGIYSSKGLLERSLIEKIEEHIDTNQLLFEAPTTQSQIQLVQSLGANVNLGNVNLNDLIGLEALRLGLRADTFNFC